MSNVESDLFDIINGYSKLYLDNKRDFFFYKHISIIDSIGLSKVYEERFAQAIKSGIKTEEQLLDEAKKSGYWSSEDEEMIKTLSWEEDKLQLSAKKVMDPSQRQSVLDRAREKRTELEEYLTKKNNICAVSAERLADQERIKRILTERSYKDKDLTQKAGKEIVDQSDEFKQFLERMGDKKHLLQIAFCGSFFDIYSIYQKHPHKVFDNTSFALTIYQKNLLMLGGGLLSKIQNHYDEMDKDKREDPVYIYEYKPKEEDKPQSDHTDLMKKARMGKKLGPEDLLQ